MSNKLPKLQNRLLDPTTHLLLFWHVTKKAPLHEQGKQVQLVGLCICQGRSMLVNMWPIMVGSNHIQHVHLKFVLHSVFLLATSGETPTKEVFLSFGV